VATLKKICMKGRTMRKDEDFSGHFAWERKRARRMETWITGPAARTKVCFAFSWRIFANFLWESATGNYKDAGVNQAMKAADEKTAAMLNATKANLTAFQSAAARS